MKPVSFISLLIFCALSVTSQVTLIKAPFYMYNYIGVVNGKMLFFANTDYYDYELWTSDGTEPGTQLLKDIMPGSFSGILPNNQWGPGYSDRLPVVFNDELYFVADDGIHGMEVWKSDGTTDGTVMLKDINPGINGFYYPEFNYPYFTEMDGYLYFAANDGTHGFELWRTDGTEVGTTMVKDISADGLYGSNPEHLVNYNGMLVFTARDDVYGYEIYKSDGTGPGTQIIKDIVPGINGSMNDGYAGSIDPYFKVCGDYLYFMGRIDGTLPVLTYLYRTDGTDAGTFTLNNSLESISNFTELGDDNYFYAYDGNPDHSGLWKSDGSTTGTVNIVTDIIFALESFYNYNDNLYFLGYDNTAGTHYGLCKSDGTGAGTSLSYELEGLASIPGIDSYVVDPLTGALFYRALFKISETAMDNRYIETNGTGAGTKIFFGAAPFRGGAFFDDKLYFPGIDTMKNDWGFYSLTPELINTEAQNHSIENKISVTPNPASELITIHLAASEVNPEIMVRNSAGEKIYAASANGVSQLSIEVHSWPEGIYFISVRDAINTASCSLVITH